MPTMNFLQFQRVMLPTLIEMREKKKSARDLAREIRKNPRDITPPEALMLLTHECRRIYSGRERRYD